MNYKTYEVNPSLADLIKCYWSLEAPMDDEPNKQRIVPDGCMEMIFHYGDKFKQFKNDGSSIIQPRCFVFGQITKPLEIAPTGVTGIFSVRFHPGGFIPFCKVPITSLENRAVALSEIFGIESVELEKEVLNSESNENRVEVVERFLVNKLSSQESIDRVVKSCVDDILKLKGQLSVNELSDQLKVHRRKLERKFSSLVGLSPKQLSRIIRLQASLKMLSDNNFKTLSNLAHEGYYYDQAHFIKDFKEFTGVSPKKFYADNLKMSSLFLTEE